MRQTQLVSDHVLNAIRRSPGILVEEVAQACPTLTWNQVFLEVDRLTRAGELRMQAEGPGAYSVRPAVPRHRIRLLTPSIG